MPKVDIEISHSVHNSERRPLKSTLQVPQRTSDKFVNLGDWPYEQIELVICGMLKRASFPDVTTPIANIQDLRQVGVTHLSYRFIDENGDETGSTVIYPD